MEAGDRRRRGPHAHSRANATFETARVVALLPGPVADDGWRRGRWRPACADAVLAGVRVAAAVAGRPAVGRSAIGWARGGSRRCHRAGGIVTTTTYAAAVPVFFGLPSLRACARHSIPNARTHEARAPPPALCSTASRVLGSLVVRRRQSRTERPSRWLVFVCFIFFKFFFLFLLFLLSPISVRCSRP